jgi:hypothetical protein
MSDDKIDLGVGMDEKYGSLGSPVEVRPPENRTVYPQFHYSGPKELELPDEGCMTIHFKKTSETSATRQDGKHWYECSIEVRQICDVEDNEPDAPSRRDTSAEDALDMLAAKLAERRGDSE